VPTMSDLLFSEFKLGRLTLKNRVVMAPMTRSRSPGNVPADIVAEYYAQRADAGLIITEGTSPSPNGVGYARIPGLYNEAQVAAWKKVTDAVHAKGGAIFVQLMHTGRVGHPLNLPAGARVLGPSAVALAGEMYTDAKGPQPHPVPEVMTEADIEHALGEYVEASKRAIAAGFDGVELHGANGYLIDQFLNVGANQRTDGWGGSVAGRVRFAAEAARRVAAAIGADRVGIRLSPAGGNGAMVTDAQTDAVYLQLAKELKAANLVYVHLVDHSALGGPAPSPALTKGIRETFGGPLIISGNFDGLRAEKALEEKRGELVAFGRPFISNPTLVKKLKTGAALRAPDFKTFYTPGVDGYLDYPLD
jgi:N-ethylmaleimide reductase